MLKQVFLGVILVGIGFLSGTYYVSKEIDGAMAIAIATQLVRQDRVLSYLEADDADTARQLQAKNMKSTLHELESMNVNWPQEVQVIVNRRGKGDAT